MKKLGVIVVSVVAALVLGLPPVLGMITESQVNARVESLAGNPFVAARVISFERGWFSSTTKIELGLSPNYLVQLAALSTMRSGPAPMTAALARGATIVVDMAHGPVPVLGGAHLGLSRMVARLDPEVEGYAELLQRLAIPYLFEFRGRTGFTGAVAFDADAPPIDVAADDGRVRFSGAVLAGSFAGGAVRYEGRVDSLEFTSGTGAFSLQGFSAAGDNEFRSPYLALGTIVMLIEHATMLDAQFSEPMFEATNLRLASEFELDDGGLLANGQWTYAIDSLAAVDMQVRDANVGVIVRNLDVDALEAYAAVMQRTAAAALVDPSQVLADVTPAIERLLAAGPSVALDPIRFSLNNELFDARIRLNAKPDALPPAGALDLRDPTLWLSLLDGTAGATISKVLARDLAIQATALQIAGNQAVPPDQAEYMAEAQAGLVLVTLVSQGILTDGGENYSTELAFMNGTLSINGNPLPFGLP